MSKAKPSSPARSLDAGDAGSAYTVLARKYRPQTFDDLIGQAALVRTLANAFRSGRIAQAYMLTGVRGVGKTTTARILARAFNYEGAGAEGPSIDMPELGPHCEAIMGSRHPDVLEMDAASHTGIDDIREIIESVRYRPLTARSKVYIIDEVHMLSKAAFNGLLKTLEEPPEHVRFIFATTEIRKVPVTVLSRCQRFDLRRVEVSDLIAHFAQIAEAEGQKIDDAALALIARAAEGSVRDGLSVLDQAIAHGEGQVSAEDVRALLGVADRGRIFELLEICLQGAAGEALAALDALHIDGAEPQRIMTDLAEAVHMVTRIKAAGPDASDPTLSEAERGKADDLAGRLSMPVLARAWQMLLKGHDEVSGAPRPIQAAEMLLVRLCYVADLPTPGEAMRADMPPAETRDNRAVPRSPAPVGSGDRLARAAQVDVEEPRQDTSANLPQPETMADIVAIAEQQRDLMLCRALESQVRLVRLKPGHLELNLLQDAPRGLASELAQKLERWTGQRWMVAVSEEEGEKTIAETNQERDAAERKAIEGHPAVRAVLDQFPGAEIAKIRPVSEED